MSRIRKDTETPGDGEQPEPVPAKRYGIYALVPERPPAPEITPTQHQEILKMLERVKAKLAIDERVGPKVPSVALETKRCAACEKGTLIHGGLRWCLACYGKL